MSFPGGHAVSAPASSRVSARLRGALGLATLVMLGLSWPLWVEPSALPRVPFVLGMPGASPRWSWAIFALLLATVAAGIVRRGALGASLVVLALLVAQDQHRLQPWVYQYFMLGLFLSSLPPRRAVACARWWLVALYFYSGLSKLDASFCRELGLTFLATAARPFGMHPEDWPASWRVAAVLAMPAFEIAVASALPSPRTRRLGLAGAVAIHAALIAILGPWGLNHSTIVLAWNAAMLIEVAILFGPDLAAEAGASGRGGRLAPIALAAFWAGLILPIGERRGWLDAWPSHALYASHVERTVVAVHEDDLGRLDPSMRRHVLIGGPGPWLRLDLTGWSRSERGVPVYPGGRACNGLAEGLAARYGDRLPFRVVQLGRADRWTGHRSMVECLGLESIRRQGGRYRLNAHPAGSSRPGRWE